MSEQLEHKVDRTNWPAGPWDKEPQDRIEWRHKGFPCLLVRNRMGAWCGYVGVSEGHRAFRKDGGDLELDVHGGITYGNHCAGVICHVPQSGEPDLVWWIGFDCSHAWDLTPSTLAYGHTPYEGEVYRDQEYAAAQVNHLAEQLAAQS